MIYHVTAGNNTRLLLANYRYVSSSRREKQLLTNYINLLLCGKYDMSMLISGPPLLQRIIHADHDQLDIDPVVSIPVINRSPTLHARMFPKL